MQASTFHGARTTLTACHRRRSFRMEITASSGNWITSSRRSPTKSFGRCTRCPTWTGGFCPEGRHLRPVPKRIAEMWGMLLISEARRQHLNVMVETSGRDVGMFHYIDHCFPDGSYRKLALHFEINDVSFAERSVDERMLREIEAGQRALAGTVDDIIKVNAGGPYGSKVLRGVQADSDRVWETEVRAGRVAQAWYKASFSITGQEAAEWTARASSSPPGVGEHPILRV
ncbi:unnamed protein product [Prorocentrum cordatum]|uniref:Uncharacterized protein n=1 Tax=Prorocentrum cordatum TaxID=2364126 RepID=A0ABN9WGZ9_9DINO|nr:unnamed protein product [Polarella glacialis]